MDADIQFGDVEESPPEVELRPDRNRHFAIAMVDSPEADDLPIFVDLDVLRDMELHALSDTNVELGGVLLGGQYEDDNGQAFVVITDSLRAKHYESTKGSFKFTHETWAEITRERDEFPDELQMVGWYHTHPDWGVFLSGMDMFICDNFFNKPLDVALVIDPCRGDRGMFQWTGDATERIRRTGGFYLMASRFREQELELYAEQLKGPASMADPRFNPGMYPAPIVNIADRSTWQTTAVLGMLSAQFFLLAIIAWRMLGTPPAEQKTSKAEEQTIVSLERKIDLLASVDRKVAEAELEMKVLDRVVNALADGPDGMVKSIKQQQEDVQSMETTLHGFQSRLKELEALRGATDLEFSTYKIEKQRELAKFATRVEQYKLLADKREKEIVGLTTRIKKLDPDAFKDPKDVETESAGGLFARNKTMLAISGGVIVAVVFAGIVMLMIRRDDELPPEENSSEIKQEPPPSNYNETDADGGDAASDDRPADR